MLRRTLTILSLIGLLISVGLWGVGYLQITWTSGKYVAVIAYGNLCFGYDYFGNTAPGLNILGPYFSTHWWPDRGLFNNDFPPAWAIQIPLWLPSLLFGLLLWLSYIPRRRKRKKLGLCIKCGYDLRASKERCPECGSTIDAR